MLPAFAIFFVEELIRLFVVGEAHFGSIVDEFFIHLAHAQGDVAEQDRFSKRCGVGEIRTWGVPCFFAFRSALPVHVLAEVAFAIRMVSSA